MTHKTIWVRVRGQKEINVKQNKATKYLSKLKLSLSSVTKQDQSGWLVTPPKSKLLPTVGYLYSVTTKHNSWVYIYITNRNLAHTVGVPCPIGNHKIMIIFCSLVLGIWRCLWLDRSDQSIRKKSHRWKQTIPFCIKLIYQKFSMAFPC